MPAVTRIGDADVTHCSSMSRAQGSSDVKANTIGISREGDLNTGHLLPGIPCPGHSAAIGQGDLTVFANGKRIGRVSDPIAGCTSVAEGSPDVFSSGGGDAASAADAAAEEAGEAGGGGQNIPVGGTTFVYILTSSVGNTCNEGDVATITLLTQNLPQGTNVPYIVTGITDADLNAATSSPLTGNFVVGSQDTKAFEFAADQVTEGTENFAITVTTQTPFTGNDSVAIAVADTSNNPTFSLFGTTTLTPQENTVGNFKLTVGSGIVGDVYPFTIDAGQGDFNATDIEYIADHNGTQTTITQIPFSTNFVLRDLGDGTVGDTFDFKISDDFTRLEGSEVMNVALDGGQASLNFTIADSSVKTESAFVYARPIKAAGVYGFEDVSLSNNQRANDPVLPQGYTTGNLATYPYAYAGAYGDTPMGGTVTGTTGANQAWGLNGMNIVYVEGMGYVWGFIDSDINNLVGATNSSDLNYNSEREMIQNQLNTDIPNLTNAMASNSAQPDTFNFNSVATATFQGTAEGITQVAFPHDYSTTPATDHSYQAATGPYHLYGAYTQTPAEAGDDNFSTYGNKQHVNGQPYTTNCGSTWHLWFFRCKRNGVVDTRPAQTKDFTYFGVNPKTFNTAGADNTTFFAEDVNWGTLWQSTDIMPDGSGNGGVDLQTDSRVTFETGISQTLGGYVHIKIDCGASRSQLIPGGAGGAKIKDGNYYEQYSYQVQTGEDCGFFGWRCAFGGSGLPIYTTYTAYRTNDGGESYASNINFNNKIELIFKMYAPGTSTFASNTQGSNIWANTLPGTDSD